jgi:hypothetical protein
MILLVTPRISKQAVTGRDLCLGEISFGEILNFISYFVLPTCII